MRNIKWLRYGLASAVIGCGAFGGVLAACGDDDSGVTANNTDGGKDGTTGNETGGGDTGTPDNNVPDVKPTPTPAKIIVIHGASAYGGSVDQTRGLVRVCYATKTSTDPDFTLSPLAPLPHSKDTDSTLPYPGIPIGAGGPFPSTGLPLEGISIRPYLVSSAALNERGIVGTTGVAATARCNRLLTAGFVPDGGFPDSSAGALAENTDYWKLADIPAGTFKNEKTYILAITGCTGDATIGAGKCGPDPATPANPYVPTGTPGVGNLRVAVMEIDGTATVATDEMGVQLVHLSPQYQFGHENVPAAIPPFSPVFGKHAVEIADASTYDAAANVRVLGPDASAEVNFTPAGSATALVKLKGIVTTTGYFAANENDPASDGPFVALPLNNAGFVDPANGKFTIQYLSEGKTVPNTAPAYTNGKAYTFVLVGDPDPLAPGLKKIHFLAFPNQFTPPPAN